MRVNEKQQKFQLNSESEEQKFLPKMPPQPIEVEPHFHCLIANDDRLQLAMLEAVFEKNKFKSICAINGQSAYEKAFAAKQNPNMFLNLVVLDLNMPVSNGFEACEKIQKLY